jgi:hypothetical protein
MSLPNLTLLQEMGDAGSNRDGREKRIWQTKTQNCVALVGGAGGIIGNAVAHGPGLATTLVVGPDEVIE